MTHYDVNRNPKDGLNPKDEFSEGTTFDNAAINPQKGGK
jgi:hypothetical protein